MPVSAAALWGWTIPTRISARAAAGAVAAAVMLASTIVFSEPAVVDALLAAMVFIVPVLGAHRFGRIALVNGALWLVIVGAGIAATMWSTAFDTAIKHQLVTFFLAAGAFVLAGFVADQPEPWLKRLFWCYLAACLVATAAALIGYFRIVPAAYDLFTNYGRARGTFKDPNVYGAALVPALTFAAWIVLRGTPRQARIAAILAAPLLLGLLLSFSRGAWFSAALSVGIVGFVLLLRSRRAADFRRFGLAGGLAAVVLAAALGAALQIEEVSTLLLQRASLDQSYDQGPQGRFGGQQKAISLILENPLGIGTHTFRDTYHHEEPHNVYLTTFLNAGWIGGLLYIISVVLTIAVGFRAALQNSPIAGMALVATASFTATAIEGFVIDSDHWRHFFILMALIWGAADARSLAPPKYGRRSSDTPPSSRDAAAQKVMCQPASMQQPAEQRRRQPMKVAKRSTRRLADGS